MDRRVVVSRLVRAIRRGTSAEGGLRVGGAHRFGIRPGLIRAGGRRPKKGVFLRRFFRELAASSPGPRPVAVAAGSSGLGSTTKTACGSCGGSGTQTCF